MVSSKLHFNIGYGIKAQMKRSIRMKVLIYFRVLITFFRSFMVREVVTFHLVTLSRVDWQSALISLCRTLSGGANKFDIAIVISDCREATREIVGSTVSTFMPTITGQTYNSNSPLRVGVFQVETFYQNLTKKFKNQGMKEFHLLYPFPKSCMPHVALMFNLCPLCSPPLCLPVPLCSHVPGNNSMLLCNAI